MTPGLKVFTDLAENGLLIAPGEMFVATPDSAFSDNECTFRIAFSSGTVSLTCLFTGTMY